MGDRGGTLPTPVGARPTSGGSQSKRASLSFSFELQQPKQGTSEQVSTRQLKRYYLGSNRRISAFFISETGRIRFRGVRLQTPNSVSFFGLTELRGANSVSSSQPFICMPKQTHRLPQNSVGSLFRTSTLETVFRPFHIILSGKVQCDTLQCSCSTPWSATAFSRVHAPATPPTVAGREVRQGPLEGV